MSRFWKMIFFIFIPLVCESLITFFHTTSGFGDIWCNPFDLNTKNKLGVGQGGQRFYHTPVSKKYKSRNKSKKVIQWVNASYILTTIIQIVSIQKSTIYIYV